ncbi:hypothetical protein KA005_29115, partial [bacterium]|nr:hypothetical protein [bacterium]
RAVAIFTHLFVFRHCRYHSTSSSSLDLLKNIRLQAQVPVLGQAPNKVIEYIYRAVNRYVHLYKVLQFIYTTGEGSAK